MNRAASYESDQELVAGAEQQAAEIRARLRSVEGEWAKALAESPVDRLKVELESDEELRATLQRELAESEVMADGERSAGYARQLGTLQRQITAKRNLLAQRSARMDQLTSDRTAAEAAAKLAEAHLQDARSAQGYRGERLRIIDPGIVPERPSQPNVLLNVLIALFAAIVLSLMYLALEASYTQQRIESNRRPAACRWMCARCR